MNLRTRKQYKNKQAAINAVQSLVEKNNSINIDRGELQKIATKNFITITQLDVALKNALNTTEIDRRVKHGKSKMPQLQKIKPKFFTDRKLTPSKAALIILAWMKSKDPSRTFCNKHHIPVDQLYNLIREIEITGKLKGKQVLDPTNFSKPKVVDVIYYYKNPGTKAKRITNLTAMEKMVYRRVAVVLLEYLEKVAHPRKNQQK